MAAALAETLVHPDAEDEIILAPSGRYAVRVDVAPISAAAPAAPPEHSAIRLEPPVSGQLKTLGWSRRGLRLPAGDEVEIEVRAAGLNFRDVMFAMGQLGDEALESGFAGPTLGMEVSGVVAATGRLVRNLVPGDEVIAFAPASFATRVLTKASAVLRKPSAWSFEAAATVPTAFFTAHYALNHLARLAEGERVLIHGAAGGVGIAAVQLAQLAGAEIFATAGSDEKRDFLRLLGADHVLNSRTLEFADQVMALTGGEGVDVVLNSLAGEAMIRSLRVLRPLGRFLELGKRDFYDDTRVGLRPFRNNVTYFGIDADQLMHERPAFTRRLMLDLMARFEEGTLKPLPFRAFAAGEAIEAFRYMQQSRHIGKIVLRMDPPPVAHSAARAPRAKLRLRAEATYLVTGGLGGFGLRTAEWLAEKGARHLVLVGRRGVPDPQTHAALAALEARGVEVRAARCDVTEHASLQQLFASIQDSMPPLRGVIHAAVVFQDRVIRNLRHEDFVAAFAPKVLGALNLHRLTRDRELDFFVLYSSAATFGNPGQANYIAANRFLEVLADARRANGLPGLCVSWGPIDEVGYLARNKEIKERVLARTGEPAIPPERALQALEQMLLDGESGGAVIPLSRGAGRFLFSTRSPKFRPLLAHAGEAAPIASDGADLERWLAELDDEGLAALFTDMLKKEVADILRLPAEKLDASSPLQDLGLDSLMGVELMTAIEARFGVSIPVVAVSDIGTTERLARRVIKELRRGRDAPQHDADAVLREQVRSVAAQHSREISPDEIEAFAAELQRRNGERGQTLRE
jgi:NADPH:quinone reductase-like Zn-dependent oxidoreductase/acyl carrier protein